jgi:hypothetical protein
MKHLFKKGEIGNPKGRPKGSYDLTAEFIRTLRKVEKDKGITLIEHFAEQAYKDKKVLVAAVKKLLPDLNHNSGEMTLTVETLPPIVRKKSDSKDLGDKNEV